MYLLINGSWYYTGYSDDSRSYSYRAAARIVEITPPVKQFFSSYPVNIRIRFPNGREVLVYKREINTRKSVNGGGYSFKRVDREFSEELIAEMTGLKFHGNVSDVSSGTFEAKVLDEKDPLEKKEIFEALQYMENEEKNYQSWLANNQWAQQAARQAQVKRDAEITQQLKNIDLNAFFKK